MTSRERVHRAVHFSSPNRIPISHAHLPGGLYELGEGLRDVFRRYPSDFAGQDPDSYTLDTDVARRYLAPCRWKDDWDCVWDFPGLGVEGIPVDGPLYQGWERLNNFRFPGRPEPAPVRPDAGAGFVMASIPGARLFERMHFLRGFENLLMDIADDAREVYLLRDRILAWQLEQLEPLLALDYVDGLSMMDDWGTQTALLIPPDRWRGIFKPAYKALFSRIREAGKDVEFHSDGMILEIIPDLIELGVTILNPQFSCMDREHLGRFRGQVCFKADIDRQRLLCFGTPAEIRDDIHAWIHAVAGPEGGIIGRAEIGPGVPLENAEAAYRAFAEFAW